VLIDINLMLNRTMRETHGLFRGHGIVISARIPAAPGARQLPERHFHVVRFNIVSRTPALVGPSTSLQKFRECLGATLIHRHFMVGDSRLSVATVISRSQH
jgi:hypothetical protein